MTKYIAKNIYATKLYRKIKAKGKYAWAKYLREKLEQYHEQR